MTVLDSGVKVPEITLFAYATKEQAMAIAEQTEERTLVAGVNLPGPDGKWPVDKNVAYLVLPLRNYPEVAEESHG